MVSFPSASELETNFDLSEAMSSQVSEADSTQKLNKNTVAQKQKQEKIDEIKKYGEAQDPKCEKCALVSGSCIKWLDSESKSDKCIACIRSGCPCRKYIGGKTKLQKEAERKERLSGKVVASSEEDINSEEEGTPVPTQHTVDKGKQKEGIQVVIGQKQKKTPAVDSLGPGSPIFKKPEIPTTSEAGKKHSRTPSLSEASTTSKKSKLGSALRKNQKPEGIDVEKFVEEQTVELEEIKHKKDKKVIKVLDVMDERFKKLEDLQDMFNDEMETKMIQFQQALASLKETADRLQKLADGAEED